MNFLNTMLNRLPAQTVYGHCDLPCGVYDPAQARIEATSVLAIMTKYHENDDERFRERCTFIKEQRAELVKHHLWVLWTDYFKPEHLERYPNLHELFWKAAKAAGKTKQSFEIADAKELLHLIAEIDRIFKETRK